MENKPLIYFAVSFWATPILDYRYVIFVVYVSARFIVMIRKYESK